MTTPVMVVTVVVAGVITFLSRVSFLLRAAPAFEGWFGRFLDAFPVALFVSLAVVQAFAPDGSFEVGPGAVGLLVGVLTCVFTRRLAVVMLAGWLAALLADLVI